MMAIQKNRKGSEFVA